MRDATSHTEKPVRILECYQQAEKKDRVRHGLADLNYTFALN
jgi:hypothetical protein